MAVTWGRVIRCALIVAAAATLLFACTPTKPSAPQPQQLEANRFPHHLHRQTGCNECHRDEKLPSQGHSPCDLGQCHRDAFLRATDSLCKTCHLAIRPPPAASTLLPFPRQQPIRSLPSRFAHDKHLDRAAMDKAVGFHVDCKDCHDNGSGQPAAASHAACSRCHAAEAQLDSAVAMAACERCHRTGEIDWRNPRSLIVGDVRFDHRNHESDKTGAQITCTTCHQKSAAGEAKFPPPNIATCVACHDDRKRVAQAHRMAECGSCHLTKQAGLLVIAPRNHLPSSEVPADHTIAFRTDHADAARDAERCAGCHREVSGASGLRSSCDECHFVRRPRSHRLTWREFDHGAESSASQARCATCHNPDYCSACHRQRPRSHGVAGAFLHGMAARVNVRSCLACHRNSDCQGSGCHEGPR